MCCFPSSPVLYDCVIIKRPAHLSIVERLGVKKFGLKATSRIKAFVFRFILVPAKWIKTSRQYALNIYSCNNAYANVFQNDFG